MKHTFYLLIVSVLFTACSSQKYKQITYFNDLKDSNIVVQQINNYNPLKIQKNDVLTITVSSLNNEASAIFNMGNAAVQGPGATAATNGFAVDATGAIQLPLIGSVQVLGLTTKEARDLVQQKLLNYLKEPVVSLTLANFKISVIGDVARPGVFPVSSERISVIDALGLAGDLTITAVRKNVLLVREVNGERKFVRIDLNTKDLFSSPYYYLQNNDALYVQPGDAKYASVDTRYRNISMGLSVLSLIIVIFTRF